MTDHNSKKKYFFKFKQMGEKQVMTGKKKPDFGRVAVLKVSTFLIQVYFYEAFMTVPQAHWCVWQHDNEK